jgi:hypothetical protein
MASTLLINSTLKRLTISSFGIMRSANVSPLILALGVNKTLEKLEVSRCSHEEESLTPALRDGLGKNSTLKELKLSSYGSLIEGFVPEVAFHRAVVEALQPNRTLKILNLCCGSPYTSHDEVKYMSHDEVKLLTLAVKKNYGLERIYGILDSEDVNAILRLNRAGRGYLAVDGSSIVKGVDVLSAD